MNGALVDTGYLVALFRRSDRLGAAARAHLRAHTFRLATVSPVIVETCFFLDPVGKTSLLEWAVRGGLAVADVPVAAYPDIKALIGKYADREMDFADAALVWFAAVSGCRSILTVDESDFSVYRVKGNKRFDVLPWMAQ
ncbi:MAG TPA: PIN domain-containing protein [Burkholderiales bacterium]|nr:PIN domain-containing protein [Burkholderiales bacterium]